MKHIDPSNYLLLSSVAETINMTNRMLCNSYVTNRVTNVTIESNKCFCLRQAFALKSLLSQNMLHECSAPVTFCDHIHNRRY